MNWTSGSCQTSCGRSVSKNVIVKKFNLLWCEQLPESPPRSSQSLWSRRSSSTFPLDPALAPHTFKVTHCSSDLRKTFLTNRTSCLGDFFASIQTPASQKTHRASTGLVDKSPWWSKMSQKCNTMWLTRDIEDQEAIQHFPLDERTWHRWWSRIWGHEISWEPGGGSRRLQRPWHCGKHRAPKKGPKLILTSLQCIPQNFSKSPLKHLASVQKIWWQQFKGIVCLDQPRGGESLQVFVEELVQVRLAVVPDHRHVDERRALEEVLLCLLQLDAVHDVPSHLLNSFETFKKWKFD